MGSSESRGLINPSVSALTQSISPSFVLGRKKKAKGCFSSVASICSIACCGETSSLGVGRISMVELSSIIEEDWIIRMASCFPTFFSAHPKMAMPLRTRSRSNFTQNMLRSIPHNHESQHLFMNKTKVGIFTRGPKGVGTALFGIHFFT